MGLRENREQKQDPYYGVSTVRGEPRRILATVLSQRRLCNQQTLADLFAVSRGTIRNAIGDVLPPLEQDGYVATPPRRYYRTAAHLLASMAATEPQSPR